jgi:hypothetical protein
MIDPLSYPWEKFSTAIYSLAGEGPLQKRIYAAYGSFHTLRPDNFTDHPDLRDQYEEIMGRLTAIKNPEKGHVPATLEQMSDDEARKVATLIIEMAFAITSARLWAAKNSN